METSVCKAVHSICKDQLRLGVFLETGTAHRYCVSRTTKRVKLKGVFTDVSLSPISSQSSAFSVCCTHAHWFPLS